MRKGNFENLPFEKAATGFENKAHVIFNGEFDQTNKKTRKRIKQ